jgi:hypothetical protein
MRLNSGLSVETSGLEPPTGVAPTVYHHDGHLRILGWLKRKLSSAPPESSPVSSGQTTEEALGRDAGAPSALTLPFDLGDIEPEVELWRGRLELSLGNDSLRLDDGRVFFTTRPKPSICFEARGTATDGTGLAKAIGNWEPNRIHLPGGFVGRLFPETISVGGNFIGANQTVAASGEIAWIAGGGHERIVAASFGLLNFADYVGTAIRHEGGVSLGRVVLEADGWRVILDKRRTFGNLKGRLQNEGGFAFTHIGRLERLNGESFSTEEARSQLSGLHWFLSLVRGAWVCPTLIAGHSSSGETLWRFWDAGRMSRWSGSPTWCDPTGWGAAQEAYVGFIREWADDFGRIVFKLSVGQYMTSNSPNPVEVAITVAQSGLELLGWVEFVESGDIPEEEWSSPRQTPASRKIGLLLDKGQIPHDIPSHLSSLIGLDDNWHTGPDVVAGVRNRLVHPSRSENRELGWSHDILIDAWFLASRYLELSILRRLGVTAPIRDRLNTNVWVGATEQPPWGLAVEEESGGNKADG